jgi:hypothetical protein
MTLSIENYLKVYDNFFDESFCDTVVNSLQKINWIENKFYSPKLPELISYNNEPSMSYDDILESNIIQNKLWFGIEQYITKDFKFCKEWFDGWNGYSRLRFNRYHINSQMKIHCDHIHSLFDGKIKGVPILSIIGLLNDNFVGGELVMWEEKIIKLKKGSIVIFPSNFMFPHMISKIISGTRYSFVSWVY